MEHLQWLMPYLEHYGYGALFIGNLLEGMLIPMPGQLLLMGASLMAAHGDMQIYLVLLAAWSGAIIGNLLGYGLGYYAGRQGLLRYGQRLSIVNPARLSRIEYYFDHYGSGLVVIAPFFEVLRQLNGFFAGTMRMPIWHFILCITLGTALWVGLWGVGAYLLGEHVQEVFSFIKKAEPYVVAAGVFVLLAATLYLLRRRGECRG
ncbi:DedA family protein [Nitrosococcus watsonii]|uniref:SNARE associated Golgi protein-related protein n=1 Tax=Nitrosococcus watsoni (strain C-113) TaxID=105559 RepID=D8K509_NITWC|nr:DedA family protein [Nitrosococcus watsonii]ADJ27986.1 SNARE associated Golgi protein-related protein [Nitrosococcus watsonii C-113]